MLRTRENSDVFNSLDEIYLVFTEKKQISSIKFGHGVLIYYYCRLSHAAAYLTTDPKQSPMRILLFQYCNRKAIVSKFYNNTVCTLCIPAFFRTSVSGILSFHLIFNNFILIFKLGARLDSKTIARTLPKATLVFAVLAVISS